MRSRRPTDERLDSPCLLGHPSEALGGRQCQSVGDLGSIDAVVVPTAERTVEEDADGLSSRHPAQGGASIEFAEEIRREADRHTIPDGGASDLGHDPSIRRRKIGTLFGEVPGPSEGCAPARA